MFDRPGTDSRVMTFSPSRSSEMAIVFGKSRRLTSAAVGTLAGSSLSWNGRPPFWAAWLAIAALAIGIKVGTAATSCGIVARGSSTLSETRFGGSFANAAA